MKVSEILEKWDENLKAQFMSDMVDKLIKRYKEGHLDYDATLKQLSDQKGLTALQAKKMLTKARAEKYIANRGIS